MATGINFAFAADVTSVLKGTADVEKALDEVASALDDVDGSALEREMSSTMSGVKSDAKDAADRLEQKFSDAFKSVKSDAKSTGDTIDREVHSGTGKAGEATGEFKNEALSNLSEVSSSFTGDMSSIADLAQGTFGGLAAMGGPLGLAAAGIAALGGIAFNNWQQKAEETKQKVSDFFDDMVTNQQNFLSESAIMTAADAIIGDDKKFAQAKAMAQDLGLSVGTVLRAMAGDSQAMRATQAALNDEVARSEDEQAKLADQYKNTGQANVDASQANAAHREELEKFRAVLDGNSDALDKASARYAAHQQAVIDDGNATKAVQDAIAGGWDNVPREVHTKVTVDTSQAVAGLNALQAQIRAATQDRTFRIGMGPGGQGGQVL